tara:strand:+ start:2153 stop:2371 length:219 start_codon:yes stop_codon:yes gene_type:complete
MLAASSLNLDYLAPNGIIGFLVVIIGVIVTTATLYVFYYVTNDVDSVLDKRRKEKAKNLQDEKIASLYPKSK